MTPEQLSELRTELQTQDNACTEHPLFCVFQKQRIYGLDSDHGGGVSEREVLRGRRTAKGAARMEPPLSPNITTRSLVGMTQGARKRAWLRGALNDYLFPHQNSTGAEHDVRSDYSWSEIRVDAPFLGTKLGERLRPCPGCSTCARPCHYCEMQEPDDSRCPRCRQVMYSTPICDGSGVLPAKRSGVAG